MTDFFRAVMGARDRDHLRTGPPFTHTWHPDPVETDDDWAEAPQGPLLTVERQPQPGPASAVTSLSGGAGTALTS